MSVPIKPQTNSRPVFLCPISGLVAVSMSNPISGYQSQLCTVLQEHVACSLLRVDPNPIISDDCTENSKDVCIVLKGYKTCSSQVFNLVAGSTLNSSAAYLRTAVKGVPSGTPKTWKLVSATMQTNIYIFILYLEGKLWVGGEGDLESDLCRCGCSHSLQERDTFIINVFLHTNAPHGIQFRLHFQGLAWIRKKREIPEDDVFRIGLFTHGFRDIWWMPHACDLGQDPHNCIRLDTKPVWKLWDVTK